MQDDLHSLLMMLPATPKMAESISCHAFDQDVWKVFSVLYVFVCLRETGSMEETSIDTGNTCNLPTKVSNRPENLLLWEKSASYCATVLYSWVNHIWCVWISPAIGQDCVSSWHHVLIWQGERNEAIFIPVISVKWALVGSCCGHTWKFVQESSILSWRNRALHGLK